jgi:formamidopyrimidine-DNA glycosylase
MIEIPEAAAIARQINGTVSGRRIKTVIAAKSPHRFAWYHEDPQGYGDLLESRVIGEAVGYGGLIEIEAEGVMLLFGDGINLRFHSENEKRPQKHQLLIEFEDHSAISASVQMYGGLWCFRAGEFENKYYFLAKEKPSPLLDEFSEAYFDRIVSAPENDNLSAKALLATEQRIPGLGNGVLQDILYNAGIHPKRKVKTFGDHHKSILFDSVKSTLAEMVAKGGRDTEKDLFGSSGGYETKLSRNTVNKPCSVCGTIVKKEAYLGGSIYYCPGCQEL